MNPCPDSGHVFLLHCDVEHLAADAVLVPGNPGPKTGVIAIESKDPRVHLFEAADFRGLLTPDKVIFHGVDVVRAFLEQATAVIGDARSQFKRAKPLLALPIFGVGRMDPDDLIRGEGSIVRALLPLLYEHASHSKLDVALCTVDKSAYQVMQVERDNLCPFKDGPFWMLSPKVKMHAEQLAKDALRGSLSLFVGAGASYPSGLPSWGGLLSDLAKKAGFTEAEQAELKSMDYLDQPTLIEERMGEQFRNGIADAVKGGRYTPVHSILAELRVPTATTNYDDLFEAATESALDDEGTIFRLPWDSQGVCETGSRTARTLTKLHGCVTQPRDIVLTRQDYMRYEDNRRALRGVVQQMLLTTNIVFVGFSMTDTNLHKIIDEVREVLHRKNAANYGDKLGTITTLLEVDLFRQLWDQDFDVVAFGKSWGDNPAWLHDCFFDYVGALVAQRKARCSFILNPKYNCLLTNEEETIAKALAPLAKIGEDPKVRATPAWSDVQTLLSLLGAQKE